MGIISRSNSIERRRKRTAHSPELDWLRTDGLHREELLELTAKRLESFGDNKTMLNKTLSDLIVLLGDVRAQSTSSEWKEWISASRSHRLRELLHEDPFTRRAYDKPRGYAGDAVLLDFIYASEERWPPPQASPLGRQIFEFTTHSPAPLGVLARRAFVARVIDRLAELQPSPDVLSIAAGHLREVLLSAAVKRQLLGRLVALDADPLSMDLVRDCYGVYGVEAHTASIRQLFARRLELGQFDFVYSTGLFDYLQGSSGRRLCSIMFEMLKPGGKLLVANFLPGIKDVGYMEVFMDWLLVFRTRHDMMELTAEIPQDAIESIRVFAEENQNIIFLEVKRK